MTAALPENNDQFVLVALKEGQEKAFDFIFRRYYKALCAQAQLYMQDLDLSQSLVQDCFIKLWESRKAAPDIENLSSWLTVVVRNKCIDHLRKQKHEASLDQITGQSSVAEGSDASLLSHEFEEQLVRAMSRLPERCRIAFEYSRFEGLTYPEIAERMNISVKGVEALMSRSLKILRAELKEYLPLILLLYKITHF
ncbi:MAG: RNA polymerase sigma-70 factor [Prolixibacteraceae bacterium]